MAGMGPDPQPVGGQLAFVDLELFCSPGVHEAAEVLAHLRSDLDGLAECPLLFGSL
jgi:hypothetical protein